MVSYGIPSKPLVDDGAKFLSKYSAELCSTLGMNNFINTEYHSQTDSQMERFNSTLISWLGHYVS